MVKILSSDRFWVDGMTLLLISNIAKDLKDEDMKAQLSDAIRLILENRVKET